MEYQAFEDRKHSGDWRVEDSTMMAAASLQSSQDRKQNKDVYAPSRFPTR